MSRETIARSYLLVAAALVPWVAYLTVNLPERSLSRHYDVTWVGFDIALLVVLARTGWFAHREDPRIVLTAAAGATMLVVDAWFDATTAADGAAFTQALVLAFGLELPGAVLSGLLAHRAITAMARTGQTRSRTSSATCTSPE